jgi:hypothetical protein
MESLRHGEHEKGTATMNPRFLRILFAFCAIAAALTGAWWGWRTWFAEDQLLAAVVRNDVDKVS